MTRPVIVFDGLCVLCSANARFVPRHDRRGHFRLAAMQGDAGAALMRRFGVDPADPATMILVDGDRALHESDAVLAIGRRLGGPWRVLAELVGIVPKRLRDALYRRIARNRYRIFGPRQTCWLPAPEQRERLL